LGESPEKGKKKRSAGGMSAAGVTFRVDGVATRVVLTSPTTTSQKKETRERGNGKERPKRVSRVTDSKKEKARSVANLKSPNDIRGKVEPLKRRGAEGPSPRREKVFAVVQR